MKIQFIIVGWHFENFPELISDLIELDKNEGVDIFWSCHREPCDRVKENFAYRVFPNLGLEDGAYQQALEYLDLSDDTILFLMHDDLEVKDWNFINECIGRLQQGHAFIGNGINYPVVLDPQEEVGGKKVIDYIKEDAKYLFDAPMQSLTLRESFICTLRKYMRDIHDFEVIWEEPKPDENGNYHIGAIGNLQQSILGYKITKKYGNRVSYLSNTYQDSDYLYEYARGKK